MTSLSQRRTRLVFETSSMVRERGKWREVIIEAHPGYAVLRLKGLRKSFTLDYSAFYSLAVKAEVAAKRAEKRGRR
jgi:hypothetical protein